jgi:serine/threonine protein kinase
MSDELNPDPNSTVDRPSAGGVSTSDYLPDEAAGTMIGPYKLLQQLGKGGMGVVWMADQTAPVQRRVALKIIKSGMDSDHVLARFEAERQALAMMDHPNIAKVLDAGATSASRPYFVMELVKGIPFTKYCDQEHLTPKERLELFIPVCNAVQHAHQKGIIHRDLKPSNVLIALYDGKPVPKVIDFGIAKAMHQKLTERTMFTEVGQIVGTLEYMAPEQAELNNLDIDTRADIYSLGVMLYELLTGAPPFTPKDLRGAAFIETMRIIREVEPAKPSAKLSKSEELPAIAAKRKLEPKKLTGLVQGDLDWVVMKCLEKDRARRYETANQLGQELQRFLTDEPVLAGPPSLGRRARNLLRRNKGLAAAMVVLFVAIVVGAFGAILGSVFPNWHGQSPTKNSAGGYPVYKDSFDDFGKYTVKVGDKSLEINLYGLVTGIHEKKVRDTHAKDTVEIKVEVPDRPGTFVLKAAPNNFKNYIQQSRDIMDDNAPEATQVVDKEDVKAAEGAFVYASGTVYEAIEYLKSQRKKGSGNPEWVDLVKKEHPEWMIEDPQVRLQIIEGLDGLFDQIQRAKVECSKLLGETYEEPGKKKSEPRSK